MKCYLAILLFALFTFSGHAQVKVDVEDKLNREANQRANSNTDKAIDKAFDSVEDGIGILFKKKDKKEKTNTPQNKEQVQDKNTTKQESAKLGTATGNEAEKEVQKPAEPNVQWSKFDFVPGDEVIFEDAPGLDEENGEFPSRWDLIGGQVEIANFDGEPVLMFLDGGQIIPFLKNSVEDYLPEVFTIEFDYYKPKDGNRITIYLTDQKNQRGKGIYNDAQEFDITPLRVDAPGGITAEHSGRDYTYCEDGCWTHISLAYTKGKLKVYLDDTRVINIPHYEFNPTGFTFYPYFADASDDKAFYAKNFRIAKGGVKYYERLLSDGKIIVNGIRFDVNKATIKPESNGAINEIFELMQKQPELNFSVEGHTDSDGDDALNQKLSEARAKAVMDRLISMGIESNRLKSSGWGESKPIGGNDTAEGKANNRRVEFVKF
jgi:outer membrane protein OmpA-like peptidoglycan-associated protein